VGVEHYPNKHATGLSLLQCRLNGLGFKLELLKPQFVAGLANEIKHRFNPIIWHNQEGLLMAHA
jgi:hypothetical protein